jgi:hypothetical protein
MRVDEGDHVRRWTHVLAINALQGRCLANDVQRPDPSLMSERCCSQRYVALA